MSLTESDAPSRRPGMNSWRRRHRALGVASAVIALALSVAACGSSSGSSGSSSSSTTGGANVAAAQAALKPYTGQPSAFPVTWLASTTVGPQVPAAAAECPGLTSASAVRWRMRRTHMLPASMLRL